MLSPAEMRELLEQARRNEEIQRRLDAVEDFLLAHHGLAQVLESLCARVAGAYHLEMVTLTLVAQGTALGAALAGAEEALAGYGCYLRSRRELRLLLVDLEQPYLDNRVPRQLARCLFPGRDHPASAAVIPLWARGEFLGTLNLGSASAQRYQPGYDTHFLQRLGRKVATGLDAALLMERARYHQKREAAVEMAGAACHELAQPLTTVSLLVEKLIRRAGGQDDLGQELFKLQEEVERLGELVQRISRVSRYVTRPYAQGLRIVDLDAAGAEMAPPAQSRQGKGEL